MTKLNAAIMEAYEGYQTALDYVKGWKQEAASRKAVCMALINAARKSNPELGVISAKDLFARTAEMWEATHTEEQEQAEAADQAPAETEQAEAADQAPAETEQADTEQAEAADQAPDEVQELNSVDA